MARRAVALDHVLVRPVQDCSEADRLALAAAIQTVATNRGLTVHSGQAAFQQAPDEPPLRQQIRQALAGRGITDEAVIGDVLAAVLSLQGA